MNQKEKAIIKVLIRYLILLFTGLFSGLFYPLLFYLTTVPVYFILDRFYAVSLEGEIFSVGGTDIGIISSCIAGSAYYLLLILNLTTEMDLKQRCLSLFFSLFSLLMINVIRISLFSILLVEEYAYFDFLHLLFWHLMSILFVVLLWFLTVFLFKIKKVPIYSDLKLIFAKDKKHLV